jgi:methionyl-tRNA formyltransferase
MRIIFCGSGQFAIPTLRALCSEGHDVPLVITQPPRPAGRGGKLRATPLHQAAEALNLDVLPCRNINAPEIVERLRDLEPEVLCVVAFGQFLRHAVRRTARFDAMNLHGSVLPKLRGAAPVNWAILRGFEQTGVTTFSLVDNMDAGPIYLTAEVPVLPEDRAGELHDRLADLGAGLVLETLDEIALGSAERIAQNDAEATFAPLLSKADGLLRFDRPAREVLRHIHGTWPWPGGRARFVGSHKQSPCTLALAEILSGPAELPAGTLDDDLAVHCTEGRLALRGLKPAGKRLMNWTDFCNGYRVQPGDRFERPENPA